MHQSEGSQERQGNGDAGDEGGAQRAEKDIDDRHHQEDGQEQRELDVAHRGAHRLGAVGEDVHVDPLRQRRLQLRQEGLHPIGRLDDVGPRLPLDVEDDGALLAGPAGELRVLHAVDHLADLVEADGRAVLVGDDERPERGGLPQLVVGGQHEILPRPIEVAFGLIDVGLREDGAHVFQRQPGQSFGIDLHAHGRLLAAIDRHQAHAENLRDLLRQDGVGGVIHLIERQRVRADAEGEDGRVGGIALAVSGRRGKGAGQEVGGGVDGRLHVLLGSVDVPLQLELQGDLGGAEARDRGHLLQRRHLPELPLERRGDGRGHRVRARSGEQRRDDDGGVIDLRQRRDRKLSIAGDAREQQSYGEQRSGDRPPDERLGDAHGLGPAGARPISRAGCAGPPCGRAATFAPGRSWLWPSTTTCSPWLSSTSMGRAETVWSGAMT